VIEITRFGIWRFVWRVTVQLDVLMRCRSCAHRVSDCVLNSLRVLHALQRYRSNEFGDFVHVILNLLARLEN